MTTFVMVVADAPAQREPGHRPTWTCILASRSLPQRGPASDHRLRDVQGHDAAGQNPSRQPGAAEVVRPLISLPKEMTLSDALRRMTAEHLHLALVRGSRGGSSA